MSNYNLIVNGTEATLELYGDVTGQELDGLHEQLQNCTTCKVIAAKGVLTTAHALFKDCYNLRDIDVLDLDVSEVTDFSDMFSHCTNLIQLDIRNFKEKHDFYDYREFKTCRMFYGCLNLRRLLLPICFNMPKDHEEMLDMFYNCYNLNIPDASLNERQAQEFEYAYSINALNYQSDIKAYFKLKGITDDSAIQKRIDELAEQCQLSTTEDKHGLLFDTTSIRAWYMIIQDKEFHDKFASFDDYGQEELDAERRLNAAISYLPDYRFCYGLKVRRDLQGFTNYRHHTLYSYRINAYLHDIPINHFPTLLKSGGPGLNIESEIQKRPELLENGLYTVVEKTDNLLHIKLLKNPDCTQVSLLTQIGLRNIYEDIADNGGTLKISSDTAITDLSYMFAMIWDIQGDLKAIDLSDLKIASPVSMSHMFSNQRFIKSVKFPKQLITVTDVSYMFDGCGDLVNVDISNFVLTNDTKFDHIFEDADGAFTFKVPSQLQHLLPVVEAKDSVPELTSYRAYGLQATMVDDIRRGELLDTLSEEQVAHYASLIHASEITEFGLISDEAKAMYVHKSHEVVTSGQSDILTVAKWIKTVTPEQLASYVNLYEPSPLDKSRGGKSDFEKAFIVLTSLANSVNQEKLVSILTPDMVRRYAALVAPATAKELGISTDRDKAVYVFTRQPVTVFELVSGK